MRVDTSKISALPVRGGYPNDEIAALAENRVACTLRPTSRGKIIGDDPRLRQLLDTIDRVAASSCTVLVTGESGTGKELVVAALHDASRRRAAPLVTINCGAIPIELVEAELFGHTRGAFTGAQSVRRGHVAEAEGGTLFLDEVGELPLAVQVKLLRLLQQREYTPLGESRAVRCDVRIVAATHRDLAADVKAGRFREDLYYRLHVIHVRLPPLRERRGDIALLAGHFFRRCVAAAGRDDLEGLSPSAMDAIEGHAWPGNVRALENAIERGVLLARGRLVEPADLFGHGLTGRSVGAPAPSRPNLIGEAQAAIRELAARSAGGAIPTVITPSVDAQILSAAARASNPKFPRTLPETGVSLAMVAESYQNNLIRQALARTGGNKNRAAQLLGLNRTTLVEMMRRRGLL